MAPLVKTGGLGDVVGALPSALARRGVTSTVMLPRYRDIDLDHHGFSRRLRSVAVTLGGATFEIGICEGDLGGVRVVLVDHPPSFDRDGLYGDAHGEYGDNALRFAIFSRAALAICDELNIRPHVLHAHDWQAAPALVYADEWRPDGNKMACVLTVHNLAYQGRFDRQILGAIGWPESLYNVDGVEFYGQVNFLKAGLRWADRITTVSPRYAEEICTPEGGAGLDGVLRAHRHKLSGILNGVDYALWNPERDAQLPASYSSTALSGKHTCKAELQRELGLPVRPHTPLCASVSRLAYQKGFDLIVELLPGLLGGDMQYVVLGTGERAIEEALVELQRHFPTKMVARIAYDDALAHRIEAGADLFVMPSRFEPCGLNQLYSLRYGTPPIVHDVGGLHDTVIDLDAKSATGTGFVFRRFDVAGLGEAWRRALLAYLADGRGDGDFAALVRRAMAQDFSWSASAERYRQLYAELLNPSTG